MNILSVFVQDKHRHQKSSGNHYGYHEFALC